jgi:hypothetical protein
MLDDPPEDPEQAVAVIMQTAAAITPAARFIGRTILDGAFSNRGPGDPRAAVAGPGGASPCRLVPLIVAVARQGFRDYAAAGDAWPSTSALSAAFSSSPRRIAWR